MKYKKFFIKTTGNEPYPYKRRLATGEELPQLLDLPTDMRKGEIAETVNGLRTTQIILHKFFIPRKRSMCNRGDGQGAEDPRTTRDSRQSYVRMAFT